MKLYFLQVKEMEIYQYEENVDPLQFDDTWAREDETVR